MISLDCTVQGLRPIHTYFNSFGLAVDSIQLAVY
jgi:hypothetical protein